MSSGSATGRIAAIWGVVGVMAIFSSAIYRLLPPARALLETPISSLQWIVFGILMGIFGFGKGYGVLHLRYAPKVVARANALSKNPSWGRLLLAPLFCMGFFGGTPRSRRAAFLITSGIVLLVILVRKSPQPWRGMIDTAVVTALTIGLLSLVWTGLREIRFSSVGSFSDTRSVGGAPPPH